MVPYSNTSIIKAKADDLLHRLSAIKEKYAPKQNS